MCGIAGFVGGDWSSAGSVAATLERMNCSMRHRGPDQADLWNDPESRAALAFNRLAILDLSPAGHQPMHVRDRPLRDRLQRRDLQSSATCAASWRPTARRITGAAIPTPRRCSPAIEAWGVRGALGRSIGMFAFALWDTAGAVADAGPRPARREAALLRAPAGRRPVPVRLRAQGAARASATSDGEIDRDALTLLLRYNYIPAPLLHLSRHRASFRRAAS